MAEKEKHPNIEDVFTAFQDFQSQISRAGINTSRMETARVELKDKFERWGLADLIDWTDRS
jgi:hypothetical protein